MRPGRVTLAVSRAVRSPMLIGLFRPIILMPVSLLSELTPQQIELILLHELAHVRRWDNLINLGQRLAEGLLFFHPAVWIVSRWLRLEREHCCDAIVLRHADRPRVYVETLASLATPRAVPSYALAAMANQQLLWRVRRILNVEDRTMCISRRTLASGLILILLTTWIGMTAAEAPKEPTRLPPPAGAPAPRDPAPKGDDPFTGTTAVPQPGAEAPAGIPGAPARALRGRIATTPRMVGGGVQPPARLTGLTRTGAGALLELAPQGFRSWGPEQATGEPKVPQAADDAHAWASRTPDGQDEWLELNYNVAVETSEILIYESYNPGAIAEVIVTDDKGAKYRVFQGKDPSAGTDMAVLMVMLAKPIRVTRVRLEIASTKIPGWNEIDAVGLRDANTKKVAWADWAQASTTYAEPQAPQDQETELERLRREVQELRQQLEAQKQQNAAQREAI
jgi:hypothetical protein